MQKLKEFKELLNSGDEKPFQEVFYIKVMRGDKECILGKVTSKEDYQKALSLMSEIYIEHGDAEIFFDDCIDYDEDFVKFCEYFSKHYELTDPIAYIFRTPKINELKKNLAVSCFLQVLDRFTEISEDLLETDGICSVKFLLDLASNTFPTQWKEYKEQQVNKNP
jgi:hypothetical protein